MRAGLRLKSVLKNKKEKLPEWHQGVMLFGDFALVHILALKGVLNRGIIDATLLQQIKSRKSLQVLL